MWGLFVGIAIGVLQLLAVNKLGRMILAGKRSEKILGTVLFVAKMTVIVFILYIISTVSLEHVVWTAGGMLLGLTAGSVYILKRRRRTNGDDKSNA
jgi:ABC-type lipoprotein release transport system permease subunit